MFVAVFMSLSVPVLCTCCIPVRLCVTWAGAKGEPAARQVLDRYKGDRGLPGAPGEPGLAGLEGSPGKLTE